MNLDAPTRASAVAGLQAGQVAPLKEVSRHTMAKLLEVHAILATLKVTLKNQRNKQKQYIALLETRISRGLERLNRG